MKIFLDEEVFDEPAWVCIYESYLHIKPTLVQLIIEVITEFRQDKHLAG